jgi:hypothetical protein
MLRDDVLLQALASANLDDLVAWHCWIRDVGKDVKHIIAMRLCFVRLVSISPLPTALGCPSSHK